MRMRIALVIGLGLNPDIDRKWLVGIQVDVKLNSAFEAHELAIERLQIALARFDEVQIALARFDVDSIHASARLALRCTTLPVQLSR